MKIGDWVYNKQNGKIGIITTDPTNASEGQKWGVLYFDKKGPQLETGQQMEELAMGRRVAGFEPVFRIEREGARLLLVVDLFSLFSWVKSLFSKEHKKIRKAALNAYAKAGEFIAVQNSYINIQREEIQNSKNVSSHWRQRYEKAKAQLDLMNIKGF
jgi:hypothetical protein